MAIAENEIARDIVDAPYKIHTTLGPGLLESVYEVVVAYELRQRGHQVVRQQPVAINYEGLVFHIRLADKRLGLLINFGANRIKDGITRRVTGLPE